MVSLLFCFLSLILHCNSQGNPWIYDLSPREAADLVAAEFRHGYEAYKTYAWGYDELKPLTFNGSNWSQNSVMITPIDSLGTMAIMGLTDLINITLTQLLCNGPNPKFSFMMDQRINMFEIVIRDLGGLVSAYHFLENNDDKECIKKLAIELGDGIYETTFNGKTNVANIPDLPWIDINIVTRKVNTNWTEFAPAGLASNIIEFGALSYIANDPKYYIAAKRTMRKIYNLRSRNTGLIGASLNIMADDISNFAEIWLDNSAHLDAQIDSYYEYMIKCYILFKDDECLKWWNDAIDSIYEYLQYVDDLNNIWFQRVDWDNGTVFGNDSRHNSYTYSLHAHFMAATLALDEKLDISTAIRNQEANHFMWNIEGITPFVYDFDKEEILGPQYDLNPEIFESNYYLYVKTGNKMYLNRTYEYLDALLTYTKCINNSECAGYSSIEDVRTKERKNVCPSFWFAESLKFLYLTFMVNENDNTFNFDEYIFNTEAHPVPIKWGNRAYLWTEPADLSGEDIWAWINIYIFSIITIIISLYMIILTCCTKLFKKSKFSKDFNELNEYEIDNYIDNFENDKIYDRDFKSSYYSAFYSVLSMICLFLSSIVILFIQTDAIFKWDFNRYDSQWDYLRWSWFIMIALYFSGKLFIFFVFSFSVNSSISFLMWTRVFMITALIILLIVQIILNDEFIDADIIYTNNDIFSRRIRGVTVTNADEAMMSVILVLLFSVNIIIIYLKRFKQLKIMSEITNTKKKTIKNNKRFKQPKRLKQLKIDNDEQQPTHMYKQTDLIHKKSSVKVYLAIKDWLLLCIFTFSSWICMILWLTDLPPSNKKGFFLPCADLMISAICLFFLYYYHEKMYQGMCKCCHNSCSHCLGIKPDHKTFNQIKRIAITKIDIRSDPRPLIPLDDFQRYGIDNE